MLQTVMQRAGWTDEFTCEETLVIYSRLAALHLARCKGEQSAALGSLIRSQDWSNLLAYNYSESVDAEVVHEIIDCRQALGFFQKLEFLDIGVDKLDVAYRSFLGTEEACKKTNELFAARIRGGLNFDPWVELALQRARSKISKLLGSAPKFSELLLRHGPGASTNVKRENASAMEKFASGICCSPKLYLSGLLPIILRQVPHWTAAHSPDYYVDDDGWLCESLPVKLSPGTLGFVPKNAKTYRTTVTEPSLNMFVQLGIGDEMARRLRRVGIDTRDQSRNRKAAHRGSITGDVATLDLKSASDLIARDLVRFLLPDDWFYLLDNTRSDVVYDKRLVPGCRGRHLHKFSTMGNGFTFPLETMIFWALTSAVCEDPKRVLAYGDDIICPTQNVGDVVKILEHCGFIINTDKSCVEGHFRESCGADYIYGIDVRPYYAKKLASTASLFVLHNYYVSRHDFEMAAVVREYIHPDLQIWGPPGYGDGHLVAVPGMPEFEGHIVNQLLNTGETRRLRSRGWAGYCFDTFTQNPVRKKTRFPGDWVTPLYTVYINGDADLDEIVRSPWSDTSDEDVDYTVQTVRFSSTKRDGRPTWTYPGVVGYSRTTIYTLG